MEKIKLRVTGNQIEVTQRPAVITAGTVGLAVEFSFDSQWEKLAKTAVFKAGDKVVATMPEKDTCSVPWEVLEKPNVWLHIGVYGANGDGTAVIPTLWAKVAVIHTGADPEGDPALEPTAPVWQAVLSRLEEVTAEGVGAATREEMDVVQDHLLSLNDEFYSHRENMDNPHGVTCDQILAVHVDELDGRVENVLFQHDLLLHATEKDNPHRVTPAQIGAVPNAAFAEKVDELLNEQGLSGHPANYSNPHYVTAEQVGAVAQEKHDTDIAELRDWAEGEIALQVESLEYQISGVKEDVEALVTEGKTVIVTLSNSTPSHTNEQIFNTVLNGGSVYLKMWAGTYIRLSWCTAEEALFEASLVISIKGADGNSYPAQNFRTYRIENEKYYANSAVVPSQAYIDAQIAYYFGNKEESL